MVYLYLLPFFIMTMPAYPWGFGIVALEYIMVCLIGKAFRRRNFSVDKAFCGKKYILPLLVIDMLFADDFCVRWSNSSKAIALSMKLQIPLDFVLHVIAAILFCGALVSLNIMFRYLERWVLYYKLKDKHVNYFNKLHFLFIILCEIFLLDYSSTDMMNFLFHRELKFWFINILLVIFMNEFIFCLVNKWKTTFVVSATLGGLWSMINHYVILYHGAPFFPSELSNFHTAAEVVKGYSLHIDFMMLKLTGIIGVLLESVLVFSGYVERENRILQWCKMLISGLASAVGIIVLLMSTYVISGWSWKQSIIEFGTPVCMINNVYEMLHTFNEPDGYSQEQLQRIISEYDTSENTIKEEADQMPDIILILNESFYNLKDYCDLEMDFDSFPSIENIEGVVQGHVVIPEIGGGTNNSEFELLTSNSMHLLNVSAPFNYIDFSKMNSHSITYFNNLGYKTYAMHCAAASNYNRDKAYPALGFNQVLLGADFFRYNTMGERDWLDRDNFLDLIQYYENDSSQPKFMYLLTYQNHGGYEQNDDSMDEVHLTTDMGNMTSQVNEYLTSIRLSVDAYKELIDYYRNSERPVVICMVGDHAPSFITELSGKQFSDEREAQLAMKSTPYLLWSNIEWDQKVFTEYISLTDILPLILYSADMPLTPYYKKIVSLHEQIPVRTKNGICMDEKKNLWNYGEKPEKEKLLNDYYYIEYNALNGRDNLREELYSVID